MVLSCPGRFLFFPATVGIKLISTVLVLLPIPGTTAQTDGVTETAERRVMEWKFDQLDKNNDGQLIRREFRVLRRLVRKVVKPKRCTKNFPRLCDTDQDRKISRSEWSVCLGIGINSK